MSFNSKIAFSVDDLSLEIFMLYGISSTNTLCHGHHTHTHTHMPLLDVLHVALYSAGTLIALDWFETWLSANFFFRQTSKKWMNESTRQFLVRCKFIWIGTDKQENTLLIPFRRRTTEADGSVSCISFVVNDNVDNTAINKYEVKWFLVWVLLWFFFLIL